MTAGKIEVNFCNFPNFAGQPNEPGSPKPIICHFFHKTLSHCIQEIPVDERTNRPSSLTSILSHSGNSLGDVTNDDGTRMTSGTQNIRETHIRVTHRCKMSLTGQLSAWCSRSVVYSFCRSKPSSMNLPFL